VKRLYCEACGTVSIVGEVAMERKKQECGTEVPCSFCAAGAESVLKELPLFETVEQFEKRTGRIFPDHGIVWVKGANRWFEKEYFYYKGHNRIVVVADFPFPPSFEWSP